MKTEEGLRSRRQKAGRPPRLSGARARAALVLDRLGAVIGFDAGWVVRSATPGLERLVGRPADHVVGQSLRSLLAPATADATITALAEAVQAASRRVVAGTLAGNRAILLAPAPMAVPSAQIYVVVTDVLDLAHRAPHSDTAEVFRARLVDVEQRLVEVALLAEIADDISGSLDPAVVLPRVADHGVRLCRAHCVAVEVLDPDSGLLAVAALAGVFRPSAAVPPAPREATLAGRALAAGSAIELTGDEAERQAARYAGGEETRFRTTLAVPLLADGAPLGAVVFCRAGTRPFDPTEIQRAQQLARRTAPAVQNARAHAALERQLAELKESQAELVQAEKLAALGRLGAGAAHEINNPLAAIVGNAELLLRREPLTSTAQERVERILHAAYRAARVIRQLLAFVRGYPIDLAPTDVVAVLRQVVAEQGEDLETDGIAVVDELESVPPVAADGRQLAQVFGHILDNALDAVKALPAETGRTIRLASGTAPGHARLHIENSGLPIAEDTLPRIFDPFFTTKAVGQGAGLGLAVCQGIVSAHGGRIFAENLPAGVAIVMELPVADVRPDTANRRPAA